MAKPLRLPRLNSAIISGRLTFDPEIRYTSNNSSFCKFSVASNRAYRDQSGNWQEETDFIDVVAWGATAQRFVDQAQKGSAVVVEGRIQTGNWEDRDGNKRKSVEINASRIQVLDMRDSGRTEPDPGRDNVSNDKPVDDDVPF